MKKMRGLFRIIFGRTAFVVLFMAIQVGILFGAFRWLEEYMHIVYAISILLSAVVIIYISVSYTHLTLPTIYSV